MSAPRRFASVSAATVNGVVPLAATPITTSSGPTAAAAMRATASATSSSAFSTARRSAPSPPAMRYTTRSSGQLKVGGSSAPSWTPIRPEVPAPT